MLPPATIRLVHLAQTYIQNANMNRHAVLFALLITQHNVTIRLQGWLIDSILHTQVFLKKKDKQM